MAIEPIPVIVIQHDADGFSEDSVPSKLTYAVELAAGLTLLTVWRLRQRLPAPVEPPLPIGPRRQKACLRRPA